MNQTRSLPVRVSAEGWRMTSSPLGVPTGVALGELRERRRLEVLNQIKVRVKPKEGAKARGAKARGKTKLQKLLDMLTPEQRKMAGFG